MSYNGSNNSGWNYASNNGANGADGSQGHGTGGSPPSSAPSVPSVYFYITPFNTPILNCTVLLADQRHLMYVVTDPQMPGYTFFRNVRGQNIALIEWQTHPMVEVNGVVSKRRVKDWLRLSEDRGSRIMEVSAMEYSWAPQNEHLNLSLGTTNPQLLGRVFRTTSTITIEMFSQALQLNILESAIVATVLLQCGRNID